MNWFATILRVVICFIILTDLTKFFVEVLCGWSVRWSRRSRCEKKEERQELKLGDSEAPQVKIKETQASKLGDAPEGIPSFFNKYRYVFGFVSFMRYVQVLDRLLHLVFIFILCCWYEIVLGLFIECSLHFTYIFWVWLYRMLNVLHLYHLKFGLPVSLYLDNRHL